MLSHYATSKAFERSLKTEFWLTGLAAFAALSAIVLTIYLVRLLGHAALGNLLEAGILPMMGFNYMRLLPVLLSLALFLGLFISLTRQIQDHEAVIWANAGLAPQTWLRPILQLALPVTLVIALFSLVALPWLAQKRAEFEQTQGAQRRAILLAPGSFTETTSASGGYQVLFIEALDNTGGEARKVFIADERNGQLGVTLATTGVITEHPEGSRFLTLEQGRRYEHRPGADAYRTLEFKRYHTRLDPVAADPLSQGVRQMSTLSLIQDPKAAHLGELVWRIGYPLSALTLALLALPLSQFNPRSGRSFNIMFAILVYATYNNLVGISESMVAQGRLHPLLSLILLHGGALAVFYGLFVWRMTPLRWRARTP
ncbi:MAG: LPS export ABC transporter permease LptF [Betaproteobacteria bacterium]|nr:LPS export ABC transporter permease LptF [Betaproteobacteria bacterium]